MSNPSSVNVGDTPPNIPSHSHADTYNWDSTFAINFTNANTAISANWPKVNDSAKNIKQTASDDPSFNLNGVFGPWQLTMGGDGKNVRMACPLLSGTYQAGSKSFDLKGVGVIIEVGMEWVPNPDQFAFVITGGTVDGIKADLDNNSIDATLKTAFTNKGVTLSATAAATVQKPGLEWWIVDGKDNYYIFFLKDKDNNEFLNIYKFESAWKNNLNVLKKEVSDEEPAVNVITITNDPTSGIAAAVLPDLLSEWFNSNIGNFNYVFAALDLSPALSQSDKYKWIKPTSTSYAVTDMGTMDSSIFGVLTMALNNQPGDNHQVSPNAIPAGKDANGANAGFLISGTMFMQQMMLPGACAIFNGADPSTSFQITNDGLTVQNKIDMVFGKFMMDNKNQGSVPTSNYPASLDAGTIPQGLIDDLNNNLNIYIDSSYKAQVTTKGSQWLLTQGQSSGGDEYILNIDSTNNTQIDVFLATVMTIPKGQFKMSLVESYVEIEFIDISYPYSSDFDVHVNYTEQVELTLQQKNGKNIFWYNQILKDMTVTATKTKSAITREIVEGAVTGALALIAVLGPIVEGLSAGAEIGEVTEEGGSAIIDEETFLQSEVDNPELTEENDLDAANNAANTSKGRLTNIKNAFNTPKWKFVGALAGLAGAVAGFDQAIDAIIENAANNKWENVPGFDDFANQVIAPYSWPGVSGYTIKSAWLAGSLQIGLQTT